MWLDAITKNVMRQVYEHDDSVDSWQGSNESQHIHAETETTPVSRRQKHPVCQPYYNVDTRFWGLKASAENNKKKLTSLVFVANDIQAEVC